MRIAIPSQLRDYTGCSAQVEARGATLAELLSDLDRRYPGIRFRMLAANDEVVIVGALSGG